MQNNQKSKFPYTPFDTYCLRTPMLSLEFFDNLIDADEISDALLKEKFQHPLVAEAIYLASPELYQQLIKWSMGEIKDLKKSNRLKSSLLKYITRMATRCTPFGLFAALGTGNLANETKIKMEPFQNFRKHTQFDMEFLVAFGNSLVNKPHIRNQLLFFPNSSLYSIGKRYRYVEYSFKGKHREYTLESVSRSEYLEGLLKTAEHGVTINTLVQQLVAEDIEKEEANAFIQELIDNQIIVSELEPTITGKDFLSVLENKLKSLSGVDEELKTIAKFQSFLAKLDQQIGNPIREYLPLKDFATKTKIPFEPKYLLQTDTFAEYNRNSLSYADVKKVKQAIAFFNKITKQNKMGLLQKFKTDFIKRFEHQKMPLLQVLDVETGIGYGQNPTSLKATPFLDDIAYFGKGTDNYTIDETPLFTILQKKISEALSEDKKSIELTEEDFPNANYNWTNAADTISAIIEIVSDNGQEKIAVRNYIEHASKLLGRFAHGNDALKCLLEEITNKEAVMNPDHVLAEIVHLPEARTGNILRRPVLREFEIPYLGKSNLPFEQQIPLEDILVCVENNIVSLYSEKLKKPLLPRLSNAHNYSNSSLPAYQFLCELQYQEQQAGGFDWPPAFRIQKFLPRVIFKDCIFSRARWNISKKDIENLFKRVENKKLTMKSISDWRKKLELPEKIQLVDGDNTLVVHLKNYTSVCMFLDTIRNRTSFMIEEFLAPEFGKEDRQSFCNQLVLSFYNHSKLNKKSDG